MKLLISLMGSAFIAMGKESNGSLYEPEYVSNMSGNGSSSKKSVDVGLSDLESVKEYVDENEVDKISMNSPKPDQVLLQVSGKVRLSTSEGFSMANKFMQAKLVEDLDEEIQNSDPKNGKFVGKKIDSKINNIVDEIPESKLPVDNLKSLYSEMANKYEKDFKKTFSDDLPSPSSYLETKNEINKNKSKTKFNFDKSIHSEPQILLPVSSNFLFKKPISNYQRNEMLNKAIDNKNINFVELEDTRTEGSKNYFIDPYQATTPATVNLYNMHAASAVPGMVGQNILPGVPTPVPGYPPIGGGVQAPPPPLRPDNLPPPPYFPPAINDEAR